MLADPVNRPLTPIQCYRSELAARPDSSKWIVLDLGAVKSMDGIDVMPAQPEGQSHDFHKAMFPLRFRVEAADTDVFRDAKTVVDQTGADQPDPRANDCLFHFAAVTGRFIRLTVTRVACWDGQEFGLALGGLQVFNGSAKGDPHPTHVRLGTH